MESRQHALETAHAFGQFEALARQLIAFEDLAREVGAKTAVV
jgi:hypothetical protein